MGYRHYFYKADIAECDAVENMTYEEFKEHIKEKRPEAYEVYKYSDDDVEDAPAVDAVPVVHGRWEEWWPGISIIMTGEEMLYRCSHCDAKYADIEGHRHCPNCGAKMDGGQPE